MQNTSRHLAHRAAFSSSPLVFITASTHQRKQVLHHSLVQEGLHEIWTRSAEWDGWFVGDYLLMPDHLHLFARPSLGAKTLQQWVKMWKSISSRKISQVLAVEAPVWQADYFDRYLRNSESYSDKWLYVELNPVRAGLVATSDQWPYKGRIWDLSM